MASKLFSGEPTLLHNPRCSKSRAARALLEERGVSFREHRYLEEPLSRGDLGKLAKCLGVPASDWVRRKESVFKEAGLDKSSPDAAILDAMARSPVLMERPILVCGDRAVLGRPPERVLELIEGT